VDGKKSLSPAAPLKLAGQLKLIGESMPTRRVWIPKPGKNEKQHWLDMPMIFRVIMGCY
jgi:RNA-directed DNA polymerase